MNCLEHSICVYLWARAEIQKYFRSIFGTKKNLLFLLSSVKSSADKLSISMLSTRILGPIHKRRWHFFRIFDIRFPMSAVSNFDQFLTPPLLPVADVIYGWPHTNNHPVWCRRLNPHTHLINIILIAIRLVRYSQYLLAHVINHFLRKNQKYKYFSVTHLSHWHNTIWTTKDT